MENIKRSKTNTPLQDMTITLFDQLLNKMILHRERQKTLEKIQDLRRTGRDYTNINRAADDVGVIGTAAVNMFPPPCASSAFSTSEQQISSSNSSTVSNSQLTTSTSNSIGHSSLSNRPCSCPVHTCSQRKSVVNYSSHVPPLHPSSNCTHPSSFSNHLIFPSSTFPASRLTDSNSTITAVGGNHTGGSSSSGSSSSFFQRLTNSGRSKARQ